MDQKITKKEFSDRVEYYNEQGQKHRLDGPAIEYNNGDKLWYQNGQRHRLDGPAYEYVNGTKRWCQNDKWHRLDGPALEYADGDKVWCQNGQRHREDGPAEEYANGDKYWYQNGQYHRLDGPAIEWANGDKEWYQNGQRHRLDGPAIEYTDGSKYWYLKNEKYSEQEFVKKTHKVLKKKFSNRVEYHNEQGQKHRLDGPAIETANGDKVWCQNDKWHREDGPAFESASGSKFWYQNGQRHREDGPAIEFANGDKYWYLNGIEYTTRNMWLKQVKKGSIEMRSRSKPDRSVYKDEKKPKRSLGNMVKEDLVNASYRVTATQMTTGVKKALLAGMANKATTDKNVEIITSVIESSVGDSLIYNALGYGLTYAPLPAQYQDDPRLNRLAAEFRIKGMEVLGNELLSTIFNAALPAITSALSSLPPLETEKKVTSKSRIKNVSKLEETEEVEEQILPAQKMAI